MNLKELYGISDYKNKQGMLFNADCLNIMNLIDDNSVDCILTDIPYDGVNKNDGGNFRKLNKGKADILTFNLNNFLDECYRIAKSSIIIFCGKDQLSKIFGYFNNKNNGSTRQLIWEKTNPSPMNGQYVYLSGIENAIWFKKRGGYLMLIVKTQYLDTHVVEANTIPQKKIINFYLN